MHMWGLPVQPKQYTSNENNKLINVLLIITTETMVIQKNAARPTHQKHHTTTATALHSNEWKLHVQSSSTDILVIIHADCRQQPMESIGHSLVSVYALEHSNSWFDSLCESIRLVKNRPFDSLVVMQFSCLFILIMKTRIGVMSCGTAGPLGSVPGMWNHLQGDQVN